MAELQKYGLKIWFDKFTLRVGSSLRQSIDEGLAKSRFGIVALSHAFFAKNWPQKELNALFSRRVDGRELILPIWHELTKEDILRYSPLVSDLTPNAADRCRAIRQAHVEQDGDMSSGQGSNGLITPHLEPRQPNACRARRRLFRFGRAVPDIGNRTGGPPWQLECRVGEQIRLS